MEKLIAGIGILLIITGLIGVGIGGVVINTVSNEVGLGLLGGLQYIIIYLLILLPVAVIFSGGALIHISRKISEKQESQ